MKAATKLADPTLRALLILIGTIALLAVVSQGSGRFLSVATVFSVMQFFATLGLVALGLGLSMLIREFDISVAGMVSLAGTIGVLTGVYNPWLGLLGGVATGLAGGMVQGLIIVGLRLSSVGVTLGGLLTFSGIAYVLTRNRSIPYTNIDVALAVNEPIFGILSLRSAVALAVFLVAAFVIAYTRIGRDVIAMGSDRGASRIAGVNVDRLMVGVFTVSGGLAGLSGVLLSYSLAARPSAWPKCWFPGRRRQSSVAFHCRVARAGRWAYSPGSSFSASCARGSLRSGYRPMSTRS